MNKLKKYIMTSMVIFVLTFGLVPTVSAHTPIGGGGENESLETAIFIPDPIKSWATYGDLHEGGEAQYYKFEIAEGQQIHLMLFTTTSAEDADFVPSMILMGPGIQSQGSIPEYVEIPPQTGQMLVSGVRAARATYEAFAPSAYVALAEISIDAPANGIYYVAVHNADRGGHYGLSIGDREDATLLEWITNPLFFPTLYLWERQNIIQVWGPTLATLIVGLFLFIRRYRAGSKLDSVGWVAAVAGLLFLATGITTAFQMILSLSQTGVDGFVIATIIFITLQILVGLLTLRAATGTSGRWSLRSRIWLAFLGVAAIFIWAGYLIGPLLAIIAAVIPIRRLPAS